MKYEDEEVAAFLAEEDRSFEPPGSGVSGSAAPVTRHRRHLVLFSGIAACFLCLLASWHAVSLPTTWEAPQIFRVLRGPPTTSMGDLPPYPMQADSPLFSARVIRSIIQHSNTSWQDEHSQAKGYFVQSLVFVQSLHEIRPGQPLKALRTRCRFEDTQERPSRLSGESGGGTYVDGIIHGDVTYPEDRFIGHSFPFTVDCQLPEQMQEDPEALGPVTLDIAFTVGRVEVDGWKTPHNATFSVSANDLPVHITPPKAAFSEFAVCVSPLTYIGKPLPLMRLLEWRTYLAEIGINRVNWYSREGELESFVQAYKSLRGGEDTFEFAPNLLDYDGRPTKAPMYADQDVWYQDCVMANAMSSSWILIIDTDEFPTVNWSAESPLDQFKNFMRQIPVDKGAVIFDRLEMARDFERGAPPQDELTQASYDCYTYFKDERDSEYMHKTVYRSNAVLTLNQHTPWTLYPMSPEAKAMTDSKETWRYSKYAQHSFEPDVWPKLAHYRWYAVPGADKCKEPSPLSGMPAYKLYLEGLDKRVNLLVQEMTPLVHRLNVSSPQ